MKISTTKTEVPYTSSFERPRSLYIAIASKRNIIETGGEVQVTWGSIFRSDRWQDKELQNSEHSHGQSQCSESSDASFVIFDCHETIIVEKSKALSFQNIFHPHPHVRS